MTEFMKTTERKCRFNWKQTGRAAPLGCTSGRLIIFFYSLSHIALEILTEYSPSLSGRCLPISFPFMRNA